MYVRKGEKDRNREEPMTKTATDYRLCSAREQKETTDDGVERECRFACGGARKCGRERGKLMCRVGTR
jgi:hypothetical protein